MTSHHCLNITSTPTPDPHITQHPTTGKFYLTFTAADHIPLWSAPDLLSFWEAQPPTTTAGPIWKPPPAEEDTHASAHLWAPELHCLHGRWYVYYAAAHLRAGNRSHRMYVLGGPKATEEEDLHAGPWEFLGSIVGMDQRQWAIDGTIFPLDGELYFVYSGWPIPPERAYEDCDERLQLLFILRMASPTTAASEPRVISRPEQPWERTGHVGINEGPQFLCSPDGTSWRGIVYSCAASWTKDYKMATLTYLGGDPLRASSWRKSRQPLLQTAGHGEGPFGPGHGSFLFLRERGETVALFHATDGAEEGFRGRKCRMQAVRWTAEGPVMGEVVGRATRDMERFNGDGGGKVGEEAKGGGGGGGGGVGRKFKDILRRYT